MPSPFPGMDPYLEDPNRWESVHTGLIYAIHAELNEILPEGIVARIDEYLWVSESDPLPSRRRVKPDAFIPDHRVADSGGVAVRTTQPTFRGTLPRSQRRRRRYIQIVDHRGTITITVLELLSPSNKKLGDDRDAYLLKRREFLAAANFIEIDLLRSGYRIPTGREIEPTADYAVFSCRRDEYPSFEQWAFDVRDRMPVIPVLYNRTDSVSLDLRTCLDRFYDEGRWHSIVDYSGGIVPPLREPDATWAVELLKKPAKKRK